IPIRIFVAFESPRIVGLVVGVHSLTKHFFFFWRGRGKLEGERAAAWILRHSARTGRFDRIHCCCVLRILIVDHPSVLIHERIENLRKRSGTYSLELHLASALSDGCRLEICAG